MNLQTEILNQQKLKEGFERLSRIREDDIEIGSTPREVVFQMDHVQLVRFNRDSSPTKKTPILISYALVNRPYMVDLQEDRSMVRSLHRLGYEVYLIDWGYPGPTERWATLDDYILEYFDACVDAVLKRTDLPSLHLLGICQGGAFALCYTSLFPGKVKNLITMVTPVDFHIPPTPNTGLLNHWVRGLDVDAMVDSYGNIPGDLMNFGYLMLRPFSLNFGKYLNLPDVMDDDRKLMNFLRMEKWIFDSPDQPAEVFRKFIREFYQNNRLCQGGLELGGRPVDLKQIRQPVLNIYAEQDHLVPPASSKALSHVLETSDYTEKGFGTGHIGMYVSGKVQRELPELVERWLSERDQ